MQCDQESGLRRAPPVSRTGGSCQSKDLALALILFPSPQPPARLLSGGLPTLVSPVPQTTVAKPSGDVVWQEASSLALGGSTAEANPPSPGPCCPSPHHTHTGHRHKTGALAVGRGRGAPLSWSSAVPPSAPARPAGGGHDPWSWPAPGPVCRLLSSCAPAAPAEGRLPGRGRCSWMERHDSGMAVGGRPPLRVVLRDPGPKLQAQLTLAQVCSPHTAPGQHGPPEWDPSWPPNWGHTRAASSFPETPALTLSV